MALKQRQARQNQLQATTFNRTIMALKHMQSVIAMGYSLAFNRTIMALKHGMGSLLTGPGGFLLIVPLWH